MIKKRIAEVSRLIVLLGIFVIVLAEIMLNTSKIEIENKNTECYTDCNFNSNIINEMSVSGIDINRQKQYTTLLIGAKEAKIKKEIEAQEKIEQEKIELEARKKAEAEAQKKAEAETKAKASIEDSESLTYEATFYTAKCNGCTGVTSSGHNVTKTIFYKGYRIVAAPPNVKFYTKLKITLTDGTVMDAIVLDRGGNIKKNRLDILVGSKKEAYNLGRQQVQVEVVK